MDDEDPERTEVNNETRAEDDVEEEGEKSTELMLCVDEKEESMEIVLCDEDEIGAYVKVRLGEGVAKDGGGGTKAVVAGGGGQDDVNGCGQIMPPELALCEGGTCGSTDCGVAMVVD